MFVLLLLLYWAGEECPVPAQCNNNDNTNIFFFPYFTATIELWSEVAYRVKSCLEGTYTSYTSFKLNSESYRVQSTGKILINFIDLFLWLDHSENSKV